ncbi:hypothetical protein ColLi_04860 [Colletotrichum liriopes]|uniref:Uncharacterized protein n=1 Tax=Colletotrichum liriopes TaxID=708192 RepID=A0AA37GKC6_9PEZI|nr:hypothetical protein ColLi_04860 [Colletotrichum liriopes]
MAVDHVLSCFGCISHVLAAEARPWVDGRGGWVLTGQTALGERTHSKTMLPMVKPHEMKRGGGGGERTKSQIPGASGGRPTGPMRNICATPRHGLSSSPMAH